MSPVKNQRLPRFHHEEEVDTEGTWAVSYGDMVTLLLTFFIVFFSIDPKQDSQRQARALQMSLLETLNKRAAAAPTGNFPNRIDNFIGKAHQIGDHLVLEFPGVSFFKSGQTELTPEGRKTLDGFVRIYLPYAGRHHVSIRAFTDHKPVLKSKHRFNDNLELSALRSIATLRVLQKSGVPLAGMKIAGYGEHVVTEQELTGLPAEQRGPASQLDLARKIVLVIEPEGT